MKTLCTKNFQFKADKVSDDGTFTGYGSVFGVKDAYDEVVQPGAFVDSLQRIKDSGRPLPALWQHNSRQPIGGYSELSEDATGLKVEGFLLTSEVAQAKEAHALMKRGIVSGLSIGYYVEDGFWNEKTRVFELRKLDLVEISVVTFPANVEAQIDGVKGIADMIRKGQFPTAREFERHLREIGFSRTEAEAITGKGFTQLRRGEPESENPAGMADFMASLSNVKL